MFSIPCRARNASTTVSSVSFSPLIALEAGDLEGEPAPIHEQADDDLRVHAALLGEPDLA